MLSDQQAIKSLSKPTSALFGLIGKISKQIRLASASHIKRIESSRLWCENFDWCYMPGMEHFEMFHDNVLRGNLKMHMDVKGGTIHE